MCCLTTPPCGHISSALYIWRAGFAELGVASRHLRNSLTHSSCYSPFVGKVKAFVFFKGLSKNGGETSGKCHTLNNVCR